VVVVATVKGLIVVVATVKGLNENLKVTVVVADVERNHTQSSTG